MLKILKPPVPPGIADGVVRRRCIGSLCQTRFLFCITQGRFIASFSNKKSHTRDLPVWLCENNCLSEIVYFFTIRFVVVPDGVVMRTMYVP